MKKPTLLVLAAGMGSRYGSLKQMDGVGPSGEAILDYSIYDAIRAGFGKVVFVIRHAFEREFREVFTPERFGGKIEVDFVFQELDTLPDGFTVPEGRVKPWGTNHAVLVARHAVQEPFAVINADDFYGRDAYRAVADYLAALDGSRNRYCMVGYRLQNTLSDFGTVSRGVCTADENGNLLSVVERTAIRRTDEGIACEEDGKLLPLQPDVPVSMNLFGFTPDYFDYSEAAFGDFLTRNGDNPQAEFYMPGMVNDLIASGRATMRVLSSPSRWFGVTYKEDKPIVAANILALVRAGEYPERLWK